MASHRLAMLQQNRISRIALGASVLVLALLLQNYLMKFPQRSVDLASRSEFSPITVPRGQAEFVIDEPLVSSPEGELFSHEPMENEVLEVHFNKARLAEETSEDLASSGFKPSLASEAIDYSPEESTRTPGPGGPCRTSLQIELNDRQQPRSLHFFQLKDTVALRRDLAMKTEGAGLVVQITTSPPAGATTETKGCRKTLRVGNELPLLVPLFVPVRVIAAADSTVRFNFRPLAADGKPLWDGAEGLFTPFEIVPSMAGPNGPPAFLGAGEVSVRRFQNDDSNPPSALSARSLAGGPLLHVDGFKVGSRELHIKLSGIGGVSVNGKADTFDLLERVQNLGLLYKAIIIAVNGALLAWVTRLIFKNPKASDSSSKS